VTPSNAAIPLAGRGGLEAAHRPSRQPHGVERADEVHPYRPLEVVERVRAAAPHHAAALRTQAGATHQNTQVRHRGNESLHRVGIGHIHRRRALEIGHHHLGTCGTQPLDRGGTETRGTTGDQCSDALHIHRPSMAASGTAACRRM
jgi:hypothetical protein